MRRALIALAALVFATSAGAAKVVCEDGLCRLVDDEPAIAPATDPGAAEVPRFAFGYMSPDEFLGFLRGEAPLSPLAEDSGWLLWLLVVLGGLALNLTPCVLPMVPVNVLIVGRSWTRGLAYGGGIALAYGALGALAAFSSLAFGAVQANAWFNLALALVLLALALALAGVWRLDFTRWRRGGAPKVTGVVTAFALGALSAVMAGACVAPVVVSVLLLTASRFAEGQASAAFLPFALGLGMALPWPFVAAGLRLLPKPGRWMTWVNRVFALLVVALAAKYAQVAATGFGWRWLSRDAAAVEGSVEVAEPHDFSLAGLRRPVLVDCWASWCANCAAMERTTLRDARVRAELRRFTVVRLRSEDIGDLRALPGFGEVRGLPAYAICE